MNDAFVAGLERLLALLDDEVTTEREQPLRVVIASALPVTIDVDDIAIAIDLAGWTKRLDRSGPDDEDAAALALDLVAAALLGRARVVQSRRDDGTLVGCEIAFLGPRGLVDFDRTSSFRWPWQRVTTVELLNPERTPHGLALGEAGLLPYAPWSGTLAQLELAAPAELPIDGELDLHNFSPKEVDPLVRAYIDECLERGIFHLRIVHGKGIGALRRTVQAILSRHPAVESQRLGGHGEGSWGATIVTLRSPVKSQ
jgi:hypothetical protein